MNYIINDKLFPAGAILHLVALTLILVALRFAFFAKTLISSGDKKEVWAYEARRLHYSFFLSFLVIG